LRFLGTTTGALVIAFILGAAACSGGEIDPVARENGVIVFLGGSFEGTPDQLFSVNEDGSGLRQLTDDVSDKTALAWSPDGSQLAYAAFRNDLTEDGPVPDLSSIYVMRSDGTDRRLLCERCTRTVYAFGPAPSSDTGFYPQIRAVPNSLAWSPQGSVVAAPAAGRGVLLIDTATGESSTITTPEPVTAIAWSPDGGQLALSHTWFMTPGNAFGTSVPRDGTELGDQRQHPRGGFYLLDVDTGGLDEVVSTDGMAHVYGWSPDGDLIAYTFSVSENRHGELAAYSVAEDRSWPLVEAELGQAGIGAGWSPVGDRFAALTDQYDEQAQQAKDLWVVSSDGTDRRGLPVCRFEGAFDGDECARATIAWSPDGTTVAYRAFISGTPIVSALIFQDVDGSSTRVVRLKGPTLDIGEGPCCLAWLPAA
jgi:WD40 repeat protein